MFARSVARSGVAVSRRMMGSHAAAPATQSVVQVADSPIIVPKLWDTLEWTLATPFNVHQFNEPPIIVEIEHLTNVKHGPH